MASIFLLVKTYAKNNISKDATKVFLGMLFLQQKELYNLGSNPIN